MDILLWPSVVNFEHFEHFNHFDRFTEFNKGDILLRIIMFLGVSFNSRKMRYNPSESVAIGLTFVRSACCCGVQFSYFMLYSSTRRWIRRFMWTSRHFLWNQRNIHVLNFASTVFAIRQAQIWCSSSLEHGQHRYLTVLFTWSFITCGRYVKKNYFTRCAACIVILLMKFVPYIWYLNIFAEVVLSLYFGSSKILSFIFTEVKVSSGSIVCDDAAVPREAPEPFYRFLCLWMKTRTNILNRFSSR